MATSYSSGDKFYIDPGKLLPLERFLPQPKYVCFSLSRCIRDLISSEFVHLKKLLSKCQHFYSLTRNYLLCILFLLISNYGRQFVNSRVYMAAAHFVCKNVMFDIA